MKFAKSNFTFFMLIFTVSLIFFSGCEQSQVASESKPLPKMDFHKPKDFSSAVERMRQVHNVLVSKSELPKATSYTVVEISHRHGEGKSHVHYKLVDDSTGHDHGKHDHDHSGQFEADPKKHKIDVDIFTELRDIVRWLPSIASDGDMPQEGWDQVKKISDDMTKRLMPMEAELAAQRDHYRSESAEFEKSIVSLEALVPPVVEQSSDE